MDVVIAGGHGQIALQLGQLLVEDGNRVRGLIRNPDHAADLDAIGVEPVVFDLEHDDGLAAAIEGADAAVFAAGAGPGSGAERKLTMDRDGAVKLIETGIRRYVVISSMGADPNAQGDDVFAVYLRAKGEADEAVRRSDLDWTIIRPGRLTDEPGTGLIALGADVVRGSIPREDVAATIRLVLPAPNTIRKTLDLVSGPLPIAEAVRAT